MVTKKKLSDSVIEELINMFKNGTLKEGCKLPNQVELSAKLGVSRTSLREAINTLELLGAVEQKPGYGTVVKNSTILNYAKQVTLPLLSNSKTTFELIQARLVLEVGLVELAVKNVTEKEIKEIEYQINQMIKSFENKSISNFIKADMISHLLIAKASKNNYLVNQLVTIRGILEQLMNEIMVAVPDLYEKSFKFHVSLFKAIKNKDTKKAVYTMKKHILNIEESLKHYYEMKKE